jgi:acetyltransferase-like isoleucine patch superfamily enzyme
LQIGTLSDLQGDCVIGDYVRTHSNVHIGKHSRVGDYVWIFPYVVLTNDPHPPSNYLVGVTVEPYAVIATMSVVLPGVTVGEHSLVAAHSMVSKDVPPHMVVGGAPAKVLTEATSIRLKDGSEEPAYPWPRHFHRGYPERAVQQWKREFGANSTYE